MATQLLNDSTFSPEAIEREARRQIDAERMTYRGTAVKAMLFLAITFVCGIIGWNRALSVIETTSSLWFLVGYFILIAISIFVATNPHLAPFAGAVYAILQGLWMGAISRVYESAWDGIVGQALVTTGAVFLVCMVLYNFEVVRVTPRFQKAVFVATLGVLITYVVGLIFSLFGVDLIFWNDPNLVGIVVSAIIAVVAALNLFVDFDYIEKGVSLGAPEEMEWYSAFALLATLLWLYLEVLRLIALLRSNQPR